jgi:hypothetical protein
MALVRTPILLAVLALFVSIAHAEPKRDRSGRSSQPSEAQLRQMLVDQSINAYSGSCPCPYSVDRAGRKCGKRSAWSRPGGEAPYCYPSDVPQEEVERLRTALATN